MTLDEAIYEATYLVSTKDGINTIIHKTTKYVTETAIYEATNTDARMDIKHGTYQDVDRLTMKSTSDTIVFYMNIIIFQIVKNDLR